MARGACSAGPGEGGMERWSLLLDHHRTGLAWLLAACRDGAAAESWACARLAAAVAALQPGWRVVPNAIRADVPNERGVKGEADALLIDEHGLCQAGGSPGRQARDVVVVMEGGGDACMHA